MGSKIVDSRLKRIAEGYCQRNLKGRIKGNVPFPKRQGAVHHISRRLSTLAVLIILFLAFPASSGAKSVTVGWDPNTENNLDGYKVYYKTGSGGPPYNGTGAVEGPSPVDVKNVTTFTLTGLSEVESYCFVATAYNTGGLESGYSNEVSVGASPNNAPPVANAGLDQTVDEGTMVQLDGTKSSDPDGGIASFFWTQTAGTPVTIADPTAAQPKFVAPDITLDMETLSFMLTVTDTEGMSSTDQCNVTLNQPASSGGTAAPFPFLEDFESGTMAAYWAMSSTGVGRIARTSSNSPYAGNYHVVMDSRTSGTYSLNELILTIDLSGRSGVALGFYHKEFSDEDHVMPSSFTGSHNSDGVAVSADGKTWYKVQGLTAVNNVSTGWKRFEVDLDAAVASAGIGYNGAFKIKFQQYDNYPTTSDGFAFDEISLNVK